MNEFASALTVLFCSITYWLGGQELPFVDRGFKWLRRYLMPIGLCASLVFLGGAVWRKALIACSLLSAATHIGYQNKIWKYALTGLLMGLPSWILCFPKFNWMVLFPFAHHTVYGFISLRFNRFIWAWVAQLMGIGIAIAYISSVS